MHNYPVLKSRDIVRVLLILGFTETRQSGSHKQFIKENLRVTVPIHNKDITLGTLKSIMRQANIFLEDLKGLI